MDLKGLHTFSLPCPSRYSISKIYKFSIFKHKINHMVILVVNFVSTSTTKSSKLHQTSPLNLILFQTKTNETSSLVSYKLEKRGFLVKLKKDMQSFSNTCKNILWDSNCRPSWGLYQGNHNYRERKVQRGTPNLIPLKANQSLPSMLTNRKTIWIKNSIDPPPPTLAKTTKKFM